MLTRIAVVQEHTELAVTSVTVHRLVICSVLLAVKMTDDRYFNNAYFAKIGGVDVSELNTMELKMLQLLDYRTHVSTADLRWLLARLKTFQGPGQINSVLCKKRTGAHVDLPTAAAPKQREVLSTAVTAQPIRVPAPVKAQPIRVLAQQATSSSKPLTPRASSCNLDPSPSPSPCPEAASVVSMAHSPSNGFSLPYSPVSSHVHLCTQQELSAVATVSVGVVEVFA